ncbi:hypothetical protein DFJ77DRAFT_479572 [Powellomyces hirtus]|nr:hypothetical protein DFJ77DRAFT_479572 [Powellomyces hirtus]
MGGGWGVERIAIHPQEFQGWESPMDLDQRKDCIRVRLSTAARQPDPKRGKRSSLQASSSNRNNALGTLDNRVGLLGQLQYRSERIDLLSRTTSVRDRGDAQQLREVAVAVFSKLHIGDEEDRKMIPLFYEVITPMGKFTYESRPFTKISKPSRKKLTAKAQLLISSGSTITMFNRTKSQTGSTRFLGVDPDSLNVQPCPADLETGLSVWDNWVIYTMDDPRFDHTTVPGCSPMVTAPQGNGVLSTVKNGQKQSKLVWARPPTTGEKGSDAVKNFVTPPMTPRVGQSTSNSQSPPGSHIGEVEQEPALVHYGDTVVLQHCATGLVLRPMIIRKIENRTCAVLEEGDVTSTGLEVRGDPISPLHKVAFQLEGHAGRYLCLGAKGGNSAVVDVHHSRQADRSSEPPPPAGRRRSSRVSRRASSRSVTVDSDADYEEGAGGDGGGGRSGSRKARAASKSASKRKNVKGSPVMDDVGEICIWTVVATDHLEATFCLPNLTPSDLETIGLKRTTPLIPHPLLPSIGAVPILHTITVISPHRMELAGENLTDDLWVFLGSHAVSRTCHESAALLHVVLDRLPPSSAATEGAAAAAARTVVPVLLARDDGVIFRTGLYWAFGPESPTSNNHFTDEQMASSALLALSNDPRP